MDNVKIIADSLEKIREPSSNIAVEIFHILKKYNINPSEEMLRELYRQLWEGVKLGFEHGINTYADIIESKLRIK